MRWWPTIGELVTYLKGEGLLEAEAESALMAALHAMRPRVPWYLKGALFLGGIFVAMVLVRSCSPIVALEPALLAVAALLLAGATTAGRYLRPERLADYLDPLLFAVALAAPPLFLAGLFDIAGNLNLRGYTATLALAGSAGFTGIFLLIYPDRWLRTLATAWVWACLTGIRFETGAEAFGDAVIGLSVAVGAAAAAARPVLAATPLRALLQPVGLGSALFGLAGMARFWNGWDAENWVYAVGVSTGVMALAATAWTLYRVRAHPGGWVVGLVGAALLAALGLSIPGLATALAFLLLALLGRDLPLLVAAIVAVVSYGSWAYTAVDLPVMYKAIALVGSGAVVLALREYLRRAVPPQAPAVEAP